MICGNISQNGASSCANLRYGRLWFNSFHSSKLRLKCDSFYCVLANVWKKVQLAKHQLDGRLGDAPPCEPHRFAGLILAPRMACTIEYVRRALGILPPQVNKSTLNRFETCSSSSSPLLCRRFFTIVLHVR